MPPPVPFPVRQAVWSRFRDGQDAPTIADALGLSPRTVRRLIQRFRSEVSDPLATSHHRCGLATPKPDAALVQRVLELRREHPTWGAGLIRVMLRRLGVSEPLPATRTLRRWLLRADLAPAPPGRRSPRAIRRATRPHEVWQMDAAELVPLRSGPARSAGYGWPTSTPAKSSGPRFSPGRWSQVPPTSTQAQLRLAFARWGRPGRLRVDNGTPWGAARGDLPTDLGLWLAGLEIGVDYNPPATPQDNGVIEW